jgi:SNF2 family DNA or RNA helicase
MQPILLRRTKRSKDKLGSPIIRLPEKVIHLWNIVLSVEERNIYDKVE